MSGREQTQFVATHNEPKFPKDKLAKSVEFLDALLTKLKEDDEELAKKVQVSLTIKEYCNVCTDGLKNTETITTNFLELPIQTYPLSGENCKPVIDLKDCLSDYCSGYIRDDKYRSIEGSVQKKCQDCLNVVDPTVEIAEGPECLTIHLSRFYGENKKHPQKISIPDDFELVTYPEGKFLKKIYQLKSVALHHQKQGSHDHASVILANDPYLYHRLKKVKKLKKAEKKAMIEDLAAVVSYVQCGEESEPSKNMEQKTEEQGSNKSQSD